MFSNAVQAMAMSSANQQNTVADIISVAAILGVTIGSIFLAQMSQKPKPVYVKVKPPEAKRDVHHPVIQRVAVAPALSHKGVDAQPAKESKTNQRNKHYIEQTQHKTGRQRFASKRASDQHKGYTVRLHKPKPQVFAPAPAGVLVNPEVINKLLNGK